MSVPIPSTTLDRLSIWVAKQRIVFTWVIGAFLLTFLLFSQPVGFEDGPHSIIEAIGFIFIILGSFGRIWCGVYIAGYKNKLLLQDGPYSLCRNPLYLFSYIGTMGIALSAQNIFLGLLITPLFWGYYLLVVKAEEEKLNSLFGEEYKKYQNKTPRIFPRFSNYWTRTELTIDSRHLLKDMKDALWFLMSVVVIELIELLKGPVVGGKAILPILWLLPF